MPASSICNNNKSEILYGPYSTCWTDEHAEIQSGPFVPILKKARCDDIFMFHNFRSSLKREFPHFSCFTETRDFTHYTNIFVLLHLLFRVLITTITTAHNIIKQAASETPNRFKEDAITQCKQQSYVIMQQLIQNRTKFQQDIILLIRRYKLFPYFKMVVFTASRIGFVWQSVIVTFNETYQQ